MDIGADGAGPDGAGPEATGFPTGLLSITFSPSAPVAKLLKSSLAASLCYARVLHLQHARQTQQQKQERKTPANRAVMRMIAG